MSDVQPHPYNSDYGNWRQTPLPELTRAQLPSSEDAVQVAHGEKQHRATAPESN